MGLPGYSTRSRTVRQVTLGYHGNEGLDTVTLDSGNTDAGNTPTTEFRPGNVVALRTSTGRYVEANDANGDRCTSPAKTSSGHTDGNGVIEVVGNHGSISVTTSTGTGTEANNATDLNANAAFAAHYVATSGGGELTITARGKGADEWFYIAAASRDGAGFSEGESNGVAGTDADYRVTRDLGILADADGTAVHDEVQAYRAGYFDESQLINLTAEARAVLSRRGSIFG